VLIRARAASIAQTTSPSYRKSDFSVLRRYSHFVWLYEALTQNNPGVIVPGMPEKHAIGSSTAASSFVDPAFADLPPAGRFGSDFVENRRVGLQTALNKIVAHPMLVGDPDLRLFLESDTFDIDVSFFL
jgi:sorting nexin-1/2